MKHPALARVMAVTLAIMCVIMLITGALGFGKTENKYAEDTADYEKLTDRITTYNELTEKLADAESYKQVSAALDEHQQQHDDDAAQFRTDLAERTAKQGGYKQGAEMLWEARAQAKDGIAQYEQAKAQFNAAEAEYNAKAAEGKAMIDMCNNMAAACTAAKAGLDAADAMSVPDAPEGTRPELQPDPDETWSEDDIKNPDLQEKLESERKAYKDSVAAQAEFDAAQKAHDDAIAAKEAAKAGANQALAGANAILTGAGAQAMPDLTSAAAALGQVAQTASAGLAEGKTQIEAARAKITAAGAAVEGAIEKIDGNLAQLWYDMGKLDDEEPELEQKRAALLDEAVELAEEKAAAEERKEDEQKLGATRRTLRSYDGIKAKLTDDAELGEVAAQYADEYYAEFNREHTARIAISVLEVLGGILGLCCIPAAFEKCRSRLVLIAPAVAAFVCAAAAEIVAVALALGQCYAALPTLVFAPLYLLAAIPVNKPPVQAQL